ncbi:TPA: virulence-associated protein D [Haemophilus influenzae]|nr:virulence-associated protein D [Haemophilus influenzae]AOZ67010.1 virulence-associated protein D [Haemophilus influenzae]MBD3607678.1 virulence-associated protein D [Haemophilus influenzae]NKB85142.1 virulence-associated protein D [Haemophilus influenzae]POP29918.1 virulence-associated protein D [Haemophilus influenzae]RDT73001.1 virulence-associated protein D [Haemophilus influenzae]
MYAIAFDLVVKDTQDYHPKGVQQAYTDIGAFLIEQWSNFTDFIRN